MVLSRTSLSFQRPVPSERSVDFLDSTAPSLLFVSRCSVCTSAEKPPLTSGVSTVVFVTRTPGLSCFESSNTNVLHASWGKTNLLAVQPKQFVVTTDSNHDLEVYLNLASRMKLSGINQLWVADITYIRLQAEFVYLAVILDAFSRKVVGWALDRTVASRLAIAALEQAIKKRQPPLGVVHHSDRGVQYASDEYVALLEKHGMIPSMSRPANPYDNASCESFIKTLKREEIYANEYDDLEHLLANLEQFIEQYYNRQRLHSALGYSSPEEFERQAENQDPAAEFRSATMRFFHA